MQLKPLHIGSVEIDWPVMLAPMAGYTDAAMRSLCLQQGAGAVYTELASAEGLRRDAGKTLQVMAVRSEERPIAGHLFGASPAAMVEAARRIEQTGWFDWIDINCGCPVKKVVSRGAGAALLKDLPRMGRIIAAVRAAVSLPVTVKTRIGFNHESANHLEIARVVEESGADLLAVHARLAKDFHGGDPDWKKLAEMKAAVSIPVVGNGGVLTAEDVGRLVAATRVDGVMIGRGALGNPWIFAEARNGGSQTHSAMERRAMMAEHLRRLVALNEQKHATLSRPIRYTAEQAACIQFRPHIPYYVRGLHEKKRLLTGLSQLLSVEMILAELDELVEHNP